MSVTVEDAVTRLRHRLLDGGYGPGTALREVAVAEDLGVSRTIARLAMATLEGDGLLVREPNRGTRLRRFTLSDIVDAISVRGALEGLAARLAAERGLDGRSEAALAEAVAAGIRILEGPFDRSAWIAANRAFHAALLDASANWAVAASVARLSTLPLVSPDAILFGEGAPGDAARAQLRGALDEHARVLDALRARQGSRAEALMREHAETSARNKRVNMLDPDTRALARSLPGGALIQV